jgi:copper chaperone CopZ
MEQKTIKISGMSCSHCAEAVTNALNSISGVSDTTVNLKSGTASFSYNPSIATLETISMVISEEGYKVIE